MRLVSQELGARLPGDVLAEVSKEVPRFNAVPLVTLDREGFSHVALLSYFELFLHGDSLHFFLNCFSRSTKFLKERPRCTLMFVHSDFVYYIKGHVRWVGDFESQSVFQFAVESVWEDFPSREEGEVFLKTGIRIGGGEEETLRRRHFREKIASQVEVRAREGRVKI